MQTDFIDYLQNMERNKVLDTAKYILIMLVVVGHFIEPTKYSNELTQHIFCSIYSFHMPLFVWISGYFYKPRTFSEEWKKCLPLLEVCLLAHLGYLLIHSGFNITIKNLVNFGANPSWYLLSLVVWRLSSSYLLKYSSRKIFVCSILVDFFAFILLAHGTFLSIGRTISFYPFFLLGYFMKDHLHILTITHKKPFIILGTAAIVIIQFLSSPLLLQIEFQRTGIRDLMDYTHLPYIEVFAIRYTALVCAILISAFFLVLVNSLRPLHALSKYGNTTLFVYYVQTLTFAAIGRWELTLWQSLVVAAVAIPLFTFAAQSKYAKWLTNPISSASSILSSHIA